jgi:hypothetical protein
MPGVAVMGELKLSPPDSVVFRGERVRCGGTVYRAVKCLLARAGGATVKQLSAAVWGAEPNSPETIRTLLWRTNNLLKGMGCSYRAMLDGGRVTLA